MALVRLVIKRRAVALLLKTPEVQADIAGRARAVAAAAGPGHRVESEVGQNRARAAVITDTREARLAEARGHGLVRAFGAGRG